MSYKEWFCSTEGPGGFVKILFFVLVNVSSRYVVCIPAFPRETVLNTTVITQNVYQAEVFLEKK